MDIYYPKREPLKLGHGKLPKLQRHKEIELLNGKELPITPTGYNGTKLPTVVLIQQLVLTRRTGDNSALMSTTQLPSSSASDGLLIYSSLASSVRSACLLTAWKYLNFGCSAERMTRQSHNHFTSLHYHNAVITAYLLMLLQLKICDSMRKYVEGNPLLLYA